ncbi:cupin domain-containing protein [Psychrobacter arenosus]|uniref:cupin domain-containing protein n=1 Tax=Psychrobacter arenosus TaxID=256326 RepID=UPI00191A8CF4|nr:cupin domain-containing protein [Psychrobacter arenosus]
MLVNADFSQRAVSLPAEQHWVNSPQQGVERIMLDRLGDEKTRATSIVRYAPESYFPHHQHPGGEEILVLSGVFSDGDDHYPTGWYIRNPPSSGHQPYSREGAIIFVKLWQMSPDEDQHVRIDTNDAANWQRQEDREVCPLFADEREDVSLRRWQAGTALTIENVKGAEILVVAGELIEGEKTYQPNSWLRYPIGSNIELAAGSEGVTVYLKTGHLAHINPDDFTAN